MKVTINIKKGYAYSIIGVLIVILGFLVVNAYNSGGPPSFVGHSAEEIDWNQTVPIIHADSICLNGECRTDWEPSATCTPATCSSLGYNCGTWSDGCGGTLNCGSCSGSQICASGTCVTTCTPETCSSLGYTCGSASDGCGGTLNCGTCGSGFICSGNHCISTCTPTNPCATKQCGSWWNGCNTVNCGTCPSTAPICLNGYCATDAGW